LRSFRISGQFDVLISGQHAAMPRVFLSARGNPRTRRRAVTATLRTLRRGRTPPGIFYVLASSHLDVYSGHGVRRPLHGPRRVADCTLLPFESFIIEGGEPAKGLCEGPIGTKFEAAQVPRTGGVGVQGTAGCIFHYSNQGSRDPVWRTSSPEADERESCSSRTQPDSGSTARYGSNWRRLVVACDRDGPPASDVLKHRRRVQPLVRGGPGRTHAAGPVTRNTPRVRWRDHFAIGR